MEMMLSINLLLESAMGYSSIKVQAGSGLRVCTARCMQVGYGVEDVGTGSSETRLCSLKDEALGAEMTSS